MQENDGYSFLQFESKTLVSISLNEFQMNDLELLLNGGFHPLKGFMNQNDYERVLKEMRLVDGTLWPIPITLDVTSDQANKLSLQQRVALRDTEGNLLAIITIDSIWEPDKILEAKSVFGTNDSSHPGVHYLSTSKSHYIGGILQGVQLPIHYDNLSLRKTPKELKEEFQSKGFKKIIGFHSKSPMHGGHFEIAQQMIKDPDSHLLLHPIVGTSITGDVDRFTRVRCYKKILGKFPSDRVTLALLPLATRMGGPREALWHAIIRKNYGCTHFVIGKSHASPRIGGEKQFYGSKDAQEFVKQYEKEIGIQVIPMDEIVYSENSQKFQSIHQMQKNEIYHQFSGTKLIEWIINEHQIPEWFAFSDIVEILQEKYPPKNKQGFTVFFTGLSGSGKTTLANALMNQLLERGGGRTITLLDGDMVRSHLSTELGFSKEHRNLNIRRISYVASEITKGKSIALIAAIAPYESSRNYGREIISQYGGFVLIHMSTPLNKCEERDRKGLYAKARSGLLKGFTGIDDPYEIPQKPELTIDTSELSVLDSVKIIIHHLTKEGYIR